MNAVVLSYVGLLTWSFLAATVLPVSSEVVLVVMVRSQHALVLPVLVATVGNYAGACTTYWLGRSARYAIDHRRPLTIREVRARHLLRRYGEAALFFSWVPFFGDVLVALAGTMDMPFGRFSLWVASGKGVRYAVVAWTAYMLLA